MKRKIVQIATMPALDAGAVPAIIALADDGTLWDGYSRYVGDKKDEEGTYMYPIYEFKWEPYPELPQDTSNLTRVKS